MALSRRRHHKIRCRNQTRSRANIAQRGIGARKRGIKHCRARRAPGNARAAARHLVCALFSPHRASPRRGISARAACFGKNSVAWHQHRSNNMRHGWRHQKAGGMAALAAKYRIIIGAGERRRRRAGKNVKKPQRSVINQCMAAWRDSKHGSA